VGKYSRFTRQKQVRVAGYFLGGFGAAGFLPAPLLAGAAFFLGLGAMAGIMLQFEVEPKTTAIARVKLPLLLMKKPRRHNASGAFLVN
jgi:hypothetical protein